MLKKSTIRDYLGVSVFLFAILTSGSVIYVINQPLSYIFGLSILVLLLIILFFFDIQFLISKSKLIIIFFIFFIIVLLLLPGIIYNGTFVGYGGLISRLIILSFLFVLLIQLHSDISRYLELSLWIVVFHALIGWFFSFLPFIKYSYITTGDYEVLTTFYVFFKWVSYDFWGVTIYRNMGIFWEPGLLQIFSNLLIFLLLLKKSNWKKLSIPIVVTVTTFSTTGFIVMTLLVLRFSNFFKVNKFLPLKFIFVFAVIFSTAVVTDDKFRGEGVGSSSARLFDFYNGVEIVKNNFFFGIGYDDDAYLQHLATGKGSSITFDNVDENRGNTNSFIKVFFVFGVPLGIVYIYILVQNQCFLSARKTFFLYVAVVSSTEPVMFMNFFLLIFISSLFDVFVKNKRLLLLNK